MKNLVFVFSFVFLSLGSLVSLEADDGFFKRCKVRRAKRCVVAQPVESCKPCVTQPVQAYNPCVTQPVQAYNPCLTTTQYTNPCILSGTSQDMTAYASVGVLPLAWDAQSGMGQTYTVMKPRETNGSEQEWQEILDQINDYLDSQDISICDLKSRFPEYGTIVADLKRSGDKASFCYPNKAAWSRRPEVRANVVRVLTNAGILQPVAEAPAQELASEPVVAPPEPVTLSGSIETMALGGASSSHTDVLEKIKSYLATNDLEICDLRSAIPAYGAIIDKLDQNEKFKPEIGAPRICYPSVEAWETDTKGAKTDILAVLAENGIL